MQIIVCRELVGDEYVTLRVIGENVSEKDIKKFILLSNDLDDSSEKAAYDIIMQISMTENKKAYSRAKEEKAVCEALGILMKDEIEAQVNEKAEDIATRMIRKNKPLDEIKEFTDIPESRIRELAAEVGLKIIN